MMRTKGGKALEGSRIARNLRFCTPLGSSSYGSGRGQSLSEESTLERDAQKGGANERRTSLGNRAREPVVSSLICMLDNTK